MDRVPNPRAFVHAIPLSAMLTFSFSIPPHSSTDKFLLFLWISPQVSPLRRPSISLPGQLRRPAYTFPWDLPFLHSNLCMCLLLCVHIDEIICFLSLLLSPSLHSMNTPQDGQMELGVKPLRGGWHLSQQTLAETKAMPALI